ncbi:CatA-like O-acetyltransferase [Pseudoflavonifractor sp. MSJ-37]|uniref:CatA-like O-acetyltransferase n=1 Tax=Pseudoflavonifractor sp. MSJ-37 TaxID=2841531 RepID=UPI001C11E721|nr:CatA-like O-acetyltransferase [Pseudoflavonifractor sp. MSJ-37]MBU5435799.1 chloramphenicol acetyltransferase [Pseudoflavonifractor sp. MSJ-37]
MQILDMETWDRREIYQFFRQTEWPFYAVSFSLDVTALKRTTKEEGLSFYYALVYETTRAMEEVEAFRLRDRGDHVVRHDSLVPSFTDLTPGSELFHITTLELEPDRAAFCRRAKELSTAQTAFLAETGAWDRDQMVFFSCLPWVPMTSMTNERDKDPADTIPRVSWGGYEERGGRLVLNMALDVNHRTIDGVHIGRFYETLCRRIAAPEAER